MTTVRNMFWALALLSLSLGAAPAAATKAVATKGKAAPPAKAPIKSATKTVAKAPPSRVPVKGATASRTPVAVKPQPQYSSRYANKRAMPVRQRTVYHPVPMTPSVERTKEIQSALAQRGYLNAEPSGAWDVDSQTAMRRFQKDQNLEADGKLNSLSLIALGLGPKRTLTASSPTTTNPAPPKP